LRNNLTIAILFLFGVQSLGQFTLELQFDPKLDGLSYEKNHPSIEQRDYEFELVKNELMRRGYFLPHAEVLFEDSTHLELKIIPSIQTEWYGLNLAQLSAESRSLLPDPRRPKKRPYSQREVESLAEILLNYYENRGYPFAEVFLDSIIWKDHILQANLMLDRGPLVRIDSIIIKGDEVMPESFVKHLLGVRQNMVYERDIIDALEKQTNSTGFVRSSKRPQILFTSESTSLYLYHEEKKSSRFDGIIGLITKENGDLQLNGHLLFDLRNSFNRGEELFFEWQAPGNSSQRLTSKIVLPYLFKTPFWLDASFALQRQDSSYLNTSTLVGIRYAPKGYEYIQVKWTQQASSALRTDLDRSFVDFSAPFWGVQWYRNPFRNEIVPLNGWAGTIDLNYGDRSSEGEKKEQWRLKLAYEKYGNLGNGFIFYGRLLTEGIISDNYLENELIRIGGNSTLRGFREEEFFTSKAALGRIEQRYLIPGGFLFVSLDYGYMETPERQSTISQAYGTAAGLALETQGGLFLLSWAMGGGDGSNFGENGSMIHFGYSNQF